MQGSPRQQVVDRDLDPGNLSPGLLILHDAARNPRLETLPLVANKHIPSFFKGNALLRELGREAGWVSGRRAPPSR